jgi:SAM-dependent methyltransferase
VDASIFGPQAYLAEYRNWPAHQKKAIRLARGRVLDVGCGAGRVALYLQRRGHEVLGIDVSPLAIKLCKRRGLKHAQVMSITQVSRRLGTFDTIVMYGNNFGLLGSFQRARWLLRRFHAMTSPRARIIAETNDIYRTKNPDHLAYHRFNRRRGRMAGQARLRVLYHHHATPYFDYLMVSREELRRIVHGTGWKIGSLIGSRGSLYIAVLEKMR